MVGRLQVGRVGVAGDCSAEGVDVTALAATLWPLLLLLLLLGFGGVGVLEFVGTADTHHTTAIKLVCLVTI